MITAGPTREELDPVRFISNHSSGKMGFAIADRSLTQAVHELHVECLPGAIPAAITADVSGLVLGHSLHVRDLVLPAGVTILDSPDQTVAAVAALQAEAVAAPAAAEPAEPEVIRERKPAEEKEKK